MKIGSLSQRAPSLLSWFVISCCFAVTVILYIMVSGFTLADNMTSVKTNYTI